MPTKRIYLDMDGTLCRFHDVEHKYIERMWEQGFYLNLQPFEEFLKAISLCIDRNPDTEFFILSAVLETEPPFAETEKREWLHTHLPQLSDGNMLFVPAGTDKTTLIPDMGADCVLIDDYNKNLSEWRLQGGTAIKFINDINDRGLGAYGGEKGNIWDGERVRYDDNQIEKACAYLRDFVSERSPNSVNIGAIDNLCTVYPEQAVYTVLTQSEKQALIDYVELVLDLSYHPSATEYRLYQMAVKERAEAMESQRQSATKRKPPDILR